MVYKFLLEQLQTYSASPECHLNLVQVLYRTPTFCNQTLLSDIQIEEIQGVIDGFQFANLDEPDTDVLGSR